MGDEFRMGAESCRWISMQTIALVYPNCAISQTLKSQRSISNELKYNTNPSLFESIEFDYHLCIPKHNSIFVVCNTRLITFYMCKV